MGTHGGGHFLNLTLADKGARIGGVAAADHGLTHDTAGRLGKAAQLIKIFLGFFLRQLNVDEKRDA